MDYLVPSAADLVDFVTDRTESPALYNELGAKGGWRGRNDRVHSAIVNSISTHCVRLGSKTSKCPYADAGLEDSGCT